MNMTITSILVVLSILAIIILTSQVKLKAFVALFIVSVFLAFTALPGEKVAGILKEGFGNTMASIGFIIIFGTILGVALEQTGAIYSIANWILLKTGAYRSPVALGITGFLTGLPIFCDSGFILLSGLAKSFSRRSGIAMSFMATVLAISLYSVHCLIPPHPGATAAASLMKADVSNLIMAGIVFAVPGTVTAYFWSRFAARKQSSDTACESESPVHGAGKDLPGIFVSFLPLIVPLALITARSICGILDTDGNGIISRILFYPGDPVFALFIGAIISLLLLKKKSMGSFNAIFSEAIEKAGPILIIVAAGGMFGSVIKATGIGEAMGNLFSRLGIGLLVPFIIAVVMKTAQGSSTVAIITTASLVSPMLNVLGLDTHWGRILSTLSMGAGSMVVSHANDAYFWVVTNFSGIEINDTLKVYSTSTIVMGLTVFACIFFSSIFIL